MTAPFERLKVWQLAYQLALQVYKLTADFPASEKYGLTSQLRRAAVGIPTNIAEGNARSHRNEYIQFCYIARGSVAETKSLLRLSLDLDLLRKEDFEHISNRYNHLGALLHALVEKLRSKERVHH